MPKGTRATIRKKKPKNSKDYCQYRHKDKRVNNPPVGLVTKESDPDDRKAEYCYDPHLDPALQFDSQRGRVEKLIDDALASGDEAEMKAALEELKRLQEPYLNWAGKAERTSFEVDTVSLHVHERIDPYTILETAGKEPGERPHRQMGLFESSFSNLPLRDALHFYKHERGWSNRLIAGDSLLVMNSLLKKESMAGRVQMIFIDPPYGIKYGSNFQPFVNKRSVKDKKDEDLTQEPEMIKAFRDTWELGIHSYLTNMHDRLLTAKELLHESGSIIVQISDENLHHVRELLDEIFGIQNFVGLISFQKTGGMETTLIPSTVDFLIWYAKEKNILKYRQLYTPRQVGHTSLDRYDLMMDSNGTTRRLTKKEKTTGITPKETKRYQLVSLVSDGASSEPESFYYNEKRYNPTVDTHWKTTLEGLKRLSYANRIELMGSILRYRRFVEDFPVVPVTDRWESTQTGTKRNYIVQTSNLVLQRCILMTTDPGDLVLDITCGSGTTAYVAEQWGRRWITCDTSRVALALTKQRLMTAAYDCYFLKYDKEGVKGGFDYKTVPHITLKSIAHNPEIDDIYVAQQPKIEKALKDLNKAAKKRLKEWEVPFDLPEDWPEAAEKPFKAFHDARQAMQKKMDASITAHAEQEILFDQPRIDKKKVRITGPFTVEAVPFPSVISLDDAEAPATADQSIARSGPSARQQEWQDELLKTGIRAKGNRKIELAEIETLAGTRQLHAIAVDKESGERIAVSFGPEYAPLEQRQVEMALDEAGNLRPKVKMVLFAAFSFDPEAAKDIDEVNWPGVHVLKVQMNTDLLTEDLKKKRSSNESFWLMGQPDVDLKKTGEGYQVEVRGFDYYNPQIGEVQSGGTQNIAMWMLDTDYDGRSLLPRQVFFPMAGAKEGWAKLAKSLNAQIDEDLIEAYRGTVSIPFESGKYGRIAVKIIDDRGIESLKILPLE